MFDFLKKGKNENTEAEPSSKIKREDVRCICSLNKNLGMHCTMDFTEEYLKIIYETGEMEIYYKDIERCGKIINSKYGIKEAMDKNILSQSVLQSKGFLAGNFYTLTNHAKEFLYIKFRDENGSVQTFLAEYNTGVEKAIKLINKKKNK